MTPKELRLYRESLLERFAGLAIDLRLAVDALTTQAVHQPFGLSGRTPYQTVSHLHDVESRVIAPRLQRILNENLADLQVASQPLEQDAPVQGRQPIQEILDAYVRLRSQELAWIEGMPPEGWNRTARHPWFGVRTFQWWVEVSLAFAEEQLRQLQ